MITANDLRGRDRVTVDERDEIVASIRSPRPDEGLNFSIQENGVIRAVIPLRHGWLALQLTNAFDPNDGETDIGAEVTIAQWFHQERDAVRSLLAQAAIDFED